MNNTPSSLTAIKVSLQKIRASDHYQPRERGLEERHVRLLLASDPDTWPPILVTPNDLDGFDVIDGFHRLEAARRLGMTEIPCVVDPRAGYPEGVAANLRHGLPLPIADRKTYALWLHEQDPSLSLRELGRQAGLNHETVRRALETPEADGATDGENRQSQQPDPIRQLVRQVDRTFHAGHGRTWLGFGSSGSPKPFRQALDAYDDEDRVRVARALKAFGQACVLAADPVLAPQADAEA